MVPTPSLLMDRSLLSGNAGSKRMGWSRFSTPNGMVPGLLPLRAFKSKAFPSIPKLSQFFSSTRSQLRTVRFAGPNVSIFEVWGFLAQSFLFQRAGRKNKKCLFFFFVRCKNFMLKIPATRKITSIRNNKGLEKEIPQGGLSKILRIHGPKQAGKNWFIPQSKNNFGAGFPDLPGLSE